MKKIFLLSCFIITNIAMISCSNDETETQPKSNMQQVSADDPGDGQSGQVPTSPPKP